MQNSVKIVIVEPNPIFREGLVQILRKAGFANCVAVNSLLDLGDDAVAPSESSLVLLDFGSEAGVIGAAIAGLRSRVPQSRIVVLAEAYSDHALIEAIKAGAEGFMMKFIDCEALVKSIELVMLGGHVFPSQVLALLGTEHHRDAYEKQETRHVIKTLSSREIDVLTCLSSGSSNKVIARQFGIAEATVKVHVKAILRKIQAKNRTEAAIWARRHGLDQDAVLRAGGSAFPAAVKTTLADSAPADAQRG
jgi:two-component system nitrate/nitrite response regulator NarL